MKSTVIRKGITASVILGLGALLSACGGGGGGGSSAASSGSTPTNNNVITGYTKDGYFSASVYVYGFNNSSATLCNSGTSSSNGYFSISLGSCSGPYLVVAIASSGTDAGTYYYLTNQASPSNPIYVTPASTVIVEEYAPTLGSAITVLSSYFNSSSSLTNVEYQESVYSNSLVSFTQIPVPVNGSYTVEYIYPLSISLSSTSIPILVKGISGSSTSIETAFGYFSSGTLYLYSNTQNTTSLSYYTQSSSLTPDSLSNITYSSITSILSPTPMIMPVTSPIQTPNPITSSSSVAPITSTGPITSSSSISIPPSSSAFSVLFSKNIYEDPNVFNVPIIKVYIDGQPVNLIVDTGDSGIMVNQSAVNIPSSDYSAYSFSYGDNNGMYMYGPYYQGVLASATVCLNPNITSSCVVMPIGVLTSGTLFPGEPNEGTFGLLGNGNGLIGNTYNGNYLVSMTAFSYPHYLEQTTGINSYQLSFASILNNYYANVSETQPIGQIRFGNYNGNSNTLIPYITSGYFYNGLSITFFGSYPDDVYFDTASPFNFLDGEDLQASQTSIGQNACTQYGWPNAIVNSSYTISYTMYSYTGSFITEPPISFCSNSPAFNLLTGITIDNSNDVCDVINDNFAFLCTNIFGLPAMLGHTFTYVLGAPGSSSQGIVQYLGISP